MSEIRTCEWDTTKEEIEYTRSPGPSTMGRSIVYITCGFCGKTVTAYLWSLAGGGKKCPCGALHNAYGTSTRKKAS